MNFNKEDLAFAIVALIVIFGGLAFSDYNKTQIELAKIQSGCKP
jgi:hypothetical protein